MKVVLFLIMAAVFSLVFVTTQGLGSSLATNSDVHKIGILDISDSTAKTLIRINLGTTSTITSVDLTFYDNIPDNSNLNIILKDKSGNIIGSGTALVHPQSTLTTINLTDTITALERPTLSRVEITMS